MSHHLKRVRIKNYRSIVDVEISLNPYALLVGENNAGKSNILSSIQWFVKPEKLDKDHFNTSGKAVEVEGEIAGITDELLDALDPGHADRLRPYVNLETLTVRRRMESPGTAKSAKLEIKNPESGDFDVNPTGIPEAISVLFPEPVRIGAMVDASEDAAKNKTTTTLGKLLAELSKPIEKGHEQRLNKIFSELEKLFSAEGDDRAEELQQFDQEASQAVQDFFPGIGLSLHIPAPTLPDLFKSGTVLIKEDEAEQARKFEELGHGAQRSVQMALVQLLASRSHSSAQNPRRTLLLIDEPELYLHPQAIEQVRLSLKDLSTAGYQVIFTTHSPLMVERDDLPSASIVSKTDVSRGTKVNERISESVKNALESDKVKQAQVLFDLGNSKEILFCKRVLLVEGDTEQRVMPSVYSAINGRSLRSDKIGIVRLSGSGHVIKSLEILDTMGVAAHALVDLDFAFRQAVTADLISEDNNDCVTVKDWFKLNKELHGFVIADDGFPTKKSNGGAEGAFKKMADDPSNEPSIQNLHNLLKGERIWFWRKGSIEHILGLNTKNNSAVIAEKCLELEAQGPTVLANQSECEAFFEWLNSYN